MSRNYAIAVASQERWYDTEDLWWKASVDGSESVQRKADVCMYSVSYILDLKNLGWVRFGCPGTELNSEIYMTAAMIVLTRGARPVLT